MFSNAQKETFQTFFTKAYLSVFTLVKIIVVRVGDADNYVVNDYEEKIVQNSEESRLNDDNNYCWQW